MKNIRFFTLIELLAAMVIITILSLLGFGVYSHVTDAAKTARAQALLTQLETGLENFYERNGYYPKSSAGGAFNPIVLTLGYDNTVREIDFGGQTLVDPTGDTPADRIQKKLFESFVKAVDLENFKQSRAADGKLTDAWGGVIYYRTPGIFKTGSFDLVSAGPDGKFSSENADDPTGLIQPADAAKFSDADGNPLCDDLFNF